MNVTTEFKNIYSWFSQQNVDPTLYFLLQPNIHNYYVFPLFLHFTVSVAEILFNSTPK